MAGCRQHTEARTLTLCRVAMAAADLEWTRCVQTLPCCSGQPSFLRCCDMGCPSMEGYLSPAHTPPTSQSEKTFNIPRCSSHARQDGLGFALIARLTLRSEFATSRSVGQPLMIGERHPHKYEAFVKLELLLDSEVMLPLFARSPRAIGFLSVAAMVSGALRFRKRSG